MLSLEAKAKQLGLREIGNGQNTHGDKAAPFCLDRQTQVDRCVELSM